MRMISKLVNSTQQKLYKIIHPPAANRASSSNFLIVHMMESKFSH